MNAVECAAIDRRIDCDGLVARGRDGFDPVATHRDMAPPLEMVIDPLVVATSIPSPSRGVDRPVAGVETGRSVGLDTDAVTNRENGAIAHNGRGSGRSFIDDRAIKASQLGTIAGSSDGPAVIDADAAGAHDMDVDTMLKLLAVAPLLTAAALVTLTLPEPAWLMSMPLPLALSTLPAVVVTPIVPPDELLITRIASPVVP